MFEAERWNREHGRGDKLAQPQMTAHQLYGSQLARLCFEHSVNWMFWKAQEGKVCLKQSQSWANILGNNQVVTQTKLLKNRPLY